MARSRAVSSTIGPVWPRRTASGIASAIAGRLGEPGVQPGPDLLRCVGAAAPLVPCDHDPGGRDACERGQAEYLPPAHVPRLRLCLPCASTWMRLSISPGRVTCGCSAGIPRSLSDL